MRKTLLLVTAALLCATIALGLDTVVICPEHGVRAVYTGNRKTIIRKAYCEYSHPTRLGKHTFWQECN